MDIRQARINMITQQMRVWDITDEKVLSAVADVPREQFVPEAYKDFAFADIQIPLGHGQVMLTPKEEAKFLQALKIAPSDVVLEIGTGSGYFTALLARLAHYVYSIDIFAEFCTAAELKLTEHKIKNVKVINADAAAGWNEKAPYDVIVITGSLPFLPDSFRHSLRPGGRLITILGCAPTMEASLITYTQQGRWHDEELFETVVPPLVNALEPSPFIF